MFNKMSDSNMPPPPPETAEQKAAREESERLAAQNNSGQGSNGGRRGGVKAKTLRRMLKKAGLKVSGKKSTLRARAKKAHLMRGGGALSPADYNGMGGGVASTAGLVGGRRHGVKATTLKKLLKRAGLKVSGKKATLRARAKKAHLVRGGA